MTSEDNGPQSREWKSWEKHSVCIVFCYLLVGNYLLYLRVDATLCHWSQSLNCASSVCISLVEAQKGITIILKVLKKSMSEKFGDQLCPSNRRLCDVHYKNLDVLHPSPSQCWIRLQIQIQWFLSYPQFSQLGVTVNPHTLLSSPHLHRAISHLYFHLFFDEYCIGV